MDINMVNGARVEPLAQTAAGAALINNFMVGIASMARPGSQVLGPNGVGWNVVGRGVWVQHPGYFDPRPGRLSLADEHQTHVHYGWR